MNDLEKERKKEFLIKKKVEKKTYKNDFLIDVVVNLCSYPNEIQLKNRVLDVFYCLWFNNKKCELKNLCMEINIMIQQPHSFCFIEIIFFIYDCRL